MQNIEKYLDTFNLFIEDLFKNLELDIKYSLNFVDIFEEKKL